MSQRCGLLVAKGIQTGNKISHSNRKARRRFLPNLQDVTLASDVLKSKFKLRIAKRTLRTIEHNGGFDSFLAGTAARKLTEEGQRLRRKVKKALKAQQDTVAA